MSLVGADGHVSALGAEALVLLLHLSAALLLHALVAQRRAGRRLQAADAALEGAAHVALELLARGGRRAGRRVRGRDHGAVARRVALADVGFALQVVGGVSSRCHCDSL